MQGETEYQELFEWIPAPLLEVDSTGRLSRANPAACRLFGYSPAELHNREISELAVHGDFTAKLTEFPDSGPFECHLLSRTGKYLNTRVHITKVARAKSEPERFRIAILEISDSPPQAAEENAQLTELIAELDLYRVRWEAILRQLPGGVLIVDAHGRVVLTNDWMQKLMKRPLPDIESYFPDREMAGWHAADGSPYLVSRWPPLRCLKTRQPIFCEEVLFDLDSHTQSHLEVSASPIRDRNNQMIAVGCLFFDVTAQRLSEKSFRASEARYRDIFEQDQAANLILTNRLDLLACNSAAIALFGYSSKKDMFASSAAGLFPSTVDRDAIADRAAEQSQTPERRYMRLHRRNGSPILVIGTLRSVQDKAGKLAEIHCHFADVTERRRAERKVSSLSTQLLRVQNQERRKLSHDLHDSTGQSLSALSMNLSLIETAIQQSNHDKVITYLTESKNLVQDCIRDIRTISYTLHPPLLDELGLAAALRWFIEGFSRRSTIEVQLDVAEDLGRLGTLVEIALFRIVQQALSNVHRHSGSKTALVRLFRQPETLVLTIADQGCGINPSASGTGSGVGLASIRQQLTFISGELEISTGPGTTLRATVPTKGLLNS